MFKKRTVVCMKKRQTKPLNQFHAAKSYVEGKIKKFGLNITAEDVVGNWRNFQGNKAPGILKPGAMIQRIPPQ